METKFKYSGKFISKDQKVTGLCVCVFCVYIHSVWENVNTHRGQRSTLIVL